MNKINALKPFFLHIALIGAFAVLAMASAFYNGVTSGNDFAQHFQFAHTIHHSIVTGEIYPSWVDNLNQGFGDAAIRFYPPLGYYALALSFILTGDWYSAALLTFFLIFWAGGIGVYFWAREEFSANESLLAAGLYIFAPYHVNQIYNNFLYAEFAASAVIPFCFLFITRVCRRGKVGDCLGLSVSYAALILTHLPLTIIGSVVFLIYAISLLKKDAVLPTISKLGASIALAGLAGSFYWLRMITELSWVKHSSEQYFSSQFDYRQNFLFTPQNILNFQTDVSVLWFADLMLLAIILIAIPSTILFLKKRKKLSRFDVSVTLVFAFAVFMCTPLSKFVWDNLPFLQKVQFPWRWLGIVSATGAVFASSGIFRASEKLNQNKNHLLSLGLCLILSIYVFVSAFVIKQAVYLTPENFNAQLKNIETANSFDCWWTIWANSEAFLNKNKLTIYERESEVISWNQTEKEFKVSGGKANSLRVATFYYPHWQANVNGQIVQIEKASDGVILIPLPENSANIKLIFREPAFVRAANFVSVSIWIFFLAFGGILFYKKIFNLRNSVEPYQTL